MKSATDYAATILADLPRDRLTGLAEKYPDAKWRKYLNLEKYVPHTLGILTQLNLIEAPPQRILDVGCGSGLLLYCARHFGHNAIGIDVDDKLLGAIANILGVDRRIAPVRPFEPIAVQGTFNVITCLGTTFNRYFNAVGRLSRRWDNREWGYFLADVESLLSPTGRLFLRINRGREARDNNLYFYDPELFRALQHGHQSGIAFLFDRDGLTRAIDA